jgi:UDP-N-acetylmuramate dehydrogenase
MNAGAYGHHIGEVLSRVRLVDRFGRISVLNAAAIPFDYRNSHLPRGSVVLSATFRCPPGRINRTLLRKSLRRGKTQPLSSRSFGSTFVNPPSSYAGKLIESCGLKGKRIGGAVISSKHANFILNVGSGTRASDFEDLINLARHEVKKKLGIMLKPEVVIIGDR